MMLKSKKFIVIAFIISLFMTLSAGSSFAVDANETDEMMVGNSENIELNSQNSEIDYSKGTFKDIQNAINAAEDGDTIILDKNEYVGNGISILMKKSVNIVGKEGMKPIINGNGLARIMYVFEEADNFKIQNCEFIGGYCPESGGGVMYILGSNIDIINCTFRDNEAKAGGAIYTNYERNKVPDAGDNIRIINCGFYNNLAYNAAGALGIYGNNCEVLNCVFNSNQAYNKIGGSYDSYGGAIQMGKDTEKVKSKCVGCLFINNSAIPRGQIVSHGGAGCIREGVEYLNCTFIGNSASYGGALTYHSSGKIDDCVFINNTAWDLYGGALTTGFRTVNMNLIIGNSQFIGNVAPLGGACYFDGKYVNFNNCTFDGNIATRDGGAMYINAGSTKVENSEIYNNVAYSRGGGIYINATSATIENNQFINNEAIPSFKIADDGLGGAIFINCSRAIITDNLFRYNVARNGSAVYVDKYNVETILNFNEMHENQAWIYHLPVYGPAEQVLYGNNVEIKSVIHGGNNIGRYLDLANSNAIYNNGNTDNILINNVTPILGATDSGKLYQDDREYDTNISIIVVNQNGEMVYKSTLSSNVYGEVNAILENPEVGNYTVYSIHDEDNYYKGMTNVTSFTVIANADLELTKTREYPTYNYGDVVLWNISIANRGPNNATKVVIRDILPDGLIWIWDNSEGKYNPETGMLNITGINSGESINLLIITQINRTGLITNNANVSSNEFDYDLDNNDDFEAIFVNPAADLEVKKTVDNSKPDFGDIVKWTVEVKNNGPDDATGVIITDLLDDGLIWIGDDGNGSYDHSTGQWIIGNLTNAQSKKLTIVSRVNKTGTIANRVNVTGNEYDHGSENNNDTKYISVSKATDLAIVENVNNPNPNFDDLIVWTIEVANNGPDNATGVVVTDVLPDGLIWVEDDSNGKYDHETGKWTIGELLNGEKITLEIKCILNKTGEFVNQVNVTGNEHDYNIENNNDSKAISVNPAADLEVKKTVDNSKPDFGDIVKWTIEVKNNGPDAANNVRVFETLPDGLTLMATNATKGSYDKGIWTIDSLAPDTTECLHICCKVDRTGEFINNVSVLGKEYDFNMKNNNDTAIIFTQTTVDLAIEVLFNNSTPNYKDNVSLTLIASNHGPDAATFVKVISTIPDGLILVNDNPDFNDGVWTIGNMSAGETRKLNLLFAVNKTGSIENPAAISGRESEINLENNHASAGIDVAPAVDLEISKTASKIQCSVGELIDYIVKIQNKGPDDAHNVVVEDIATPQVLFVEYSADRGVFSNNGTLWSLSTLESGQTATLNFKALVESAGTVLNGAVVSCDEYDLDYSNNAAEIAVAVEDVVNDTLNNKTGKDKYNITRLSSELMENSNIESVIDYPELEKTGSPVVILILSLLTLIPFGLGYFSKK